MKAKDLMNMVRQTDSSFFKYQRANLTESNFYSCCENNDYYSVIDFVHDYNTIRNKVCDKYF